MRPAQFDITYKNFPMEGNMHGLIGYLKQWMQDNAFITYTLQSLNDKMVRGYFLRDAQSSQTLIAQMLPFTQSQPLDLSLIGPPRHTDIVRRLWTSPTTSHIMPGSRLCRVLAAYLPKDPTIPKKENKARVDHSE